jgi:tetratricopeptide (TPR) repeat protein
VIWCFRLILVVIIILGMITSPLKNSWQSNIAALRLRNLWVAEPVRIQDTPCAAKEISDDIERYLYRNKANASRNVNLVHVGWVLWLKGNCVDSVSEQTYAENNVIAVFERVRAGDFEALTLEERSNMATYLYHFSKGRNTPLQLFLVDLSFALAPQLASARMLSEQYQTAGDTGAEQVLWQRLIEAVPDDFSEYWWAVAELSLLEEDWQAAALAYAHGAELAVEPYDYWMESGQAWEKVHNWDAAVNSYEYARRTNTSLLMPYLNLGNVYRLQEQYLEALEWYAMAERLHSDNYAPHYFQGLTYYLMKDYSQAQHHLSIAIEMKPDLSLGMYYLALVAHAQGQINEADLWLNQAIIYQPRAETAVWWLIRLGDWRLEYGNCLGAFEAYSSSSELAVLETSKMIEDKFEVLSKTCQP